MNLHAIFTSALVRKNNDMAVPTRGTFTEEHEEADRRLRKYALTKRGRRAIDGSIISEWSRSGAEELMSNNARARIEFMGAALEQFERRHRKTTGRSFFFLTLAPKAFAVPLADASNFNHSRLQAWAAELLTGFDYIGIVEAAFYGNIGVNPEMRGQTVSWHVHALVWNAEERNVQGLVDAVNRDNEPLLPGSHAATVKKRGATGAAGRLIYMLKGQRKEYRAYRLKEEKVDHETGEITTPAVGRWRQRKRTMRTGDLAKMSKVMAGRTIPILCFSGGAGRGFWMIARINARKSIGRANALAAAKLEPYRAALAVLPAIDVRPPTIGLSSSTS